MITNPFQRKAYDAVAAALPFAIEVRFRNFFADCGIEDRGDGGGSAVATHQKTRFLPRNY